MESAHRARKSAPRAGDAYARRGWGGQSAYSASTPG